LPEQKLKIVQSLQNSGHIVAMMGDGVNDALALKTADIGVVVGEATDVAKQTADMVLLDSNFSTIITAIEQGRVIFSNIKKVLVYLLSGSFTELMLIGTSLAFGLPIPVLPAQILWVNLFEDSLPGLALAFEKGDHDVLNQKPRPKNAELLDKEVKTIIFAVGIVSDILLLGLFLILLNLGLPIEKVRTMMFLSLAFDSLLFVFSTRDLKKNIWEYNPFANKFLNLSVFVGFLFILIVTYIPLLNKVFSTVPLSSGMMLIVIGLGFKYLIGIELVKLKFKRVG
jgi:Ca2+-transporting ATPase